MKNQREGSTVPGYAFQNVWKTFRKAVLYRLRLPESTKNRLKGYTLPGCAFQKQWTTRERLHYMARPSTNYEELRERLHLYLAEASRKYGKPGDRLHYTRLGLPERMKNLGAKQSAVAP
jgi:hypothetical protein